MSWVTIAESDIITKLSGPEISAMKSAALAAGQANPLPEIITQVVAEIRGYVAGCSSNTLGEGATIPSELLGTAIARIRYELATRLPVETLLTEPRKTANEDALTRLRDVAACRFAIVPPATAAPAEDQAGGTSTPRVCRPRKKFTDRSQDGI